MAPLVPAAGNYRSDGERNWKKGAAGFFMISSLSSAIG